MEYQTRSTDCVKDHLTEALELATDAEQKRHIREALQLMEGIDQESATHR